MFTSTITLMCHYRYKEWTRNHCGRASNGVAGVGRLGDVLRMEPKKLEVIPVRNDVGAVGRTCNLAAVVCGGISIRPWVIRDRLDRIRNKCEGKVNSVLF